MENQSHILYTSDSAVPIVCDRPDWRKCPEHKYLTQTKPNIKPTLHVEEPSTFDDPHDDIISVTEYAGTPNYKKPEVKKSLADNADLIGIFAGVAGATSFVAGSVTIMATMAASAGFASAMVAGAVTCGIALVLAFPIYLGIARGVEAVIDNMHDRKLRKEIAKRNK